MKKECSKIVSEKDEGIYDADMKKGIRVANGEIIHFLNCGDYFCDNQVIEKIVEVFINNRDCAFILRRFLFCITRTKLNLLFGYRKNITHIISQGINHQSTFVRRAVVRLWSYLILSLSNLFRF